MHGLTWFDWCVLGLVVVFSVRGLFRGTIAQIFGLLGLVLGFFAAAWVLRWVGAQWDGARPAVVFWAMKLLVAALAGLVVASLIQWWGERIRDAVHSGPLGSLDRLGGGIVGLGIGIVVAALVVLGAASFPWRADVRTAVSRSRTAVPLLRAGSALDRLDDRFLPGAHWWGARFAAAERRALLARRS